jgi:hypothetical protein
MCTAFDIETNAWFDINPLSAPRVNCSAVVLNSRYIYLMPGSNPTAVRGNSIAIEYMDTGNIADLLQVPQNPSSFSINGPPTASAKQAPIAPTQIQGMYLTNCRWE